MIYSFLPSNYKKRLRRDYRSRVLTVFFCALATAFFIGDIALVPSLLISQSKHSELALALSNTIKQNETNEPLPQEQVTQANAYLMHLSVQPKSPVDSVVKVASLKNPGIKISEIEVGNSIEGMIPVSVTGVALTRDSLITWKKALENDAQVTKVDLPVSDLAKSKDIEFIVKISIKYE
jgi:hypothetical protein